MLTILHSGFITVALNSLEKKLTSYEEQSLDGFFSTFFSTIVSSTPEWLSPMFNLQFAVS